MLSQDYQQLKSMNMSGNSKLAAFYINSLKFEGIVLFI